MPEYINPNTFTVHLAGPDGKIVKVKSRQKVVLSEFFDRYRSRGFIKLVSEVGSQSVPAQKIQAKINLTTPIKRRQHQSITRPPAPAPQAQARIPSQDQMLQDRKKRREEITRARKISKTTKPQKTVVRRTGNQIVGRTINTNPTELLKSNLAKGNYPISNGVGVGILSFNRKDALQRLVNSIIATTDLRRTTIFISDDGSTNQDLKTYLDELAQNDNFVIIKNDTRIGIAGNTNRLLRCLSRFEYGLILNDDIEIMSPGWDTFYMEAMQKTGMHHFIYRQEGVYGATLGEARAINNVNMHMVSERPHGAILAFTNHMLDKCGYFDEGYGYYGMEHVDWSRKTWEFGLQSEGFYDVTGSDRYFYLHSDVSAVENRQTLLRDAKKRFDSRIIQRCAPSDASRVPAISYIIPFRNIGRTDAIKSVVNNIRSQRFPVVDILLVEQDSESRINIADFKPVSYYLARETNNLLFNKSMAFNLAASKVVTERVILHDADIMVQGHYTAAVYKILDTHTACHLGNSVIYADTDSSNVINTTGLVTNETNCERVVGYFEGGSIACHMKTYWQCGAFNQDFWGYGCEDCDFYARLAANSVWAENRTFDFLHLWHGRVAGWNTHHETNRRIEAALTSRPMYERVQLQHSQLHRLGYGHFIT